MSDVDVVVVGGGAAGLSAALAAARTRRVLLVVKGTLGDGSTAWAQGGIAATIDPQDSIADHLTDTLRAGVDLCDHEAVRAVVSGAPEAISWLQGIGARFDTEADGRLRLGREGGHGRNRIVHAGGDRTGAEVSRTLVAAVRATSIEVLEGATVTDVLLDDAGNAAGVAFIDANGVHRTVSSRAVVLATGGVGQLYQTTTNPAECTGEGIALALRAGAVVSDAEFVQFHPTVLWSGPDRTGQQPLVTEALRGAGAVLVDAAGRRVMAGQHPLADLAPRDVVASRLHEVIISAGSTHVFLDATELGRTRLERDFPNVVAACRRAGVDPVAEPIPVAPGAHYHCGGVRTDLDGQTDVAGLFAVGEVARTGLHGANRLASNSLLEAVEIGGRAGRHLARRLPWTVGAAAPAPSAAAATTEAAHRIPHLMSHGAGVWRDATGLSRLVDDLDKLAASAGTPGTVEEYRAAHMVITASAIANGALLREESRGCHRRQDFPETNPQWHRPVLTRLFEGRVRTWTERAEQSA